MTIETHKYAAFLDRVAADIDISPRKYKEAVNRYEGVAGWLHDGAYADASGAAQIYSQGSFRLGTVVRPIRDGIEAAYDIDLVCQLPIVQDSTSTNAVKLAVGNRLRENGTYKKLLDEEGRRCWTLEYAEADGVGFHMDVLPCVPDGRSRYPDAISITHKDEETYVWRASNPIGYGRWFDGKNADAVLRVGPQQKASILREAPEIYASIDQVPDQLVRTPLQRAIQLMKRHRDVQFNRRDRIAFAPISIVITTLAAHLYRDEIDVLDALSGIVQRLQMHASLLEGRDVDRSLSGMGLIRRTPDGKWYIGNPANPAENFADRWHEDGQARARARFPRLSPADFAD